MSQWIIVGVIASAIVSNSSFAALHLGMKLACKRYGDAWSSGDRTALEAAVTDEFAAVWRRVPDAMFAKLPRTTSTDSAVLSSQKSPNDATVSVQTADGNVVFHLTGAGFQWRVADVDVENINGETVSLKQSLEASLTSRDFLVGLSDPKGRSWNGCLSRSMQKSVQSLSGQEWQLVQAYLPPIKEPTPGKRPMVRFFGRLASMAVTLPGGESFVQVTLVNEGAWKVDDLELSGRKLRIPSFRKGLPALAAVAKLGQFMKDPKLVDPASFVADPKLRQELAHLHAGTSDAPGLGAQKMEHIRIAQDAHVYVKYPNRWIVVSTQTVGGRVMVSNLQLHEAGAWRNAAELLALQRKLKSSPLADWLGGVSMTNRQ